MVHKMVKTVVNQMESNKMIDEELKECYIYALVTLAERWVTIITIVIISLMWDKFIPSIIFLICFLSLRRRTGGFHADKFWQCYIGTVATYILIVCLCPVLCERREVLYGIVICAIIVIAAIGTVNHPNMALDSLELKASKKTSRYLLVLESLILFVAVILRLNFIYIYYMSMAIILCAIMLCTSKIIRQEV